MATYAVQGAGGPVHVEAETWQVDDSGTLGMFDAGGRMVAAFWPGEWSGEVTEALPEPVNDNAPPVANPEGDAQ